MDTSYKIFLIEELAKAYLFGNPTPKEKKYIEKFPGVMERVDYILEQKQKLKRDITSLQ